MEMNIVTATREVEHGERINLEDLEIIAGKNAGISQIRDTYYNSPVSDSSRALPRFKATALSGHTSVSNHAKVEVVFDGASRLMAMIMNNLRYYDTTERSGRFTEMVGNTQDQCELYDKWNNIFKERILEIYPDFNDEFLRMQLGQGGFIRVSVKNGELVTFPNVDGVDEDYLHRAAECLDKARNMQSLPVNTRSQENARYILSIFTKSTTFGYTTSIDQWNFIYDWCERYINQFHLLSKDDCWYRRSGDTMRKATWFECQILDDLFELRDFIRDNLYIPELRDHKKRCFNLLTNLFEDGEDGDMNYFDFHDDVHLGMAYSVTYEASFILLSHLHRHRTLKYMAKLPSPDKMHFFVPPFIRDTPLEKEWLDDMRSVAEYYPQGTLVEVLEVGSLDDFALKATERFCGCAMWETMNNVREVAMAFVEQYEQRRLTALERRMVERFYDPATKQLKTKAQMTDGCHEGCYFGCAHAFDRIV